MICHDAAVFRSRVEWRCTWGCLSESKYNVVRYVQDEDAPHACALKGPDARSAHVGDPAVRRRPGTDRAPAPVRNWRCFHRNVNRAHHLVPGRVREVESVPSAQHRNRSSDHPKYENAEQPTPTLAGTAVHVPRYDHRLHRPNPITNRAGHVIGAATSGNWPTEPRRTASWRAKHTALAPRTRSRSSSRTWTSTQPPGVAWPSRRGSSSRIRPSSSPWAGSCWVSRRSAWTDRPPSRDPPDARRKTTAAVAIVTTRRTVDTDERGVRPNPAVSAVWSWIHEAFVRNLHLPGAPRRAIEPRWRLKPAGTVNDRSVTRRQFLGGTSVVAAGAALEACAPSAASFAPRSTADPNTAMVLRNATVLTMDSASPAADAVAIVGDTLEIRRGHGQRCGRRQSGHERPTAGIRPGRPPWTVRTNVAFGVRRRQHEPSRRRIRAQRTQRDASHACAREPER